MPATAPKKAPQRKARVIERASTSIKGQSKTQLTSFTNFIRTQGVIGLAVGLVIGGAVGVVVKSLVNNIVMPPLGLVLGSADGLNGLVLKLGKTPEGQAAVIHYGTFLNDLINFLVIALVIYLVIHGLRLDRLDKKKEDA